MKSTRDDYLLLYVAWCVTAITVAVDLCFTYWIIIIGRQINLFHKYAFELSGDVTKKCWIFIAIGIACIVMCVRLCHFTKNNMSLILCIVINYIILVLSGVLFWIYVHNWVRSSIFV